MLYITSLRECTMLGCTVYHRIKTTTAIWTYARTLNLFRQISIWLFINVVDWKNWRSTKTRLAQSLDLQSKNLIFSVNANEICSLCKQGKILPFCFSRRDRLLWYKTLLMVWRGRNIHTIQSHHHEVRIPRVSVRRTLSPTVWYCISCFSPTYYIA